MAALKLFYLPTKRERERERERKRERERLAQIQSRILSQQKHGE